MKKQLLSFLITSVIMVYAINLSAQGFYVSANVGYGFKMSSQNIVGFTNENDSPSIDDVTQINLSMGQGFNFCGTAGYMFTKNIGAELGLSYLLGMKTKANYENNTTNHIHEGSYAGGMFKINPTFVVSAGLQKVDPYAKFGFIIGFGSIFHDFNSESPAQKSYYKAVYSGGVAFGLNAAAGVLFNLNERFSLFAETSMVNLSYAPTKGKIKEFTINGADQLNSMTTSEKEFVFVKNIDYHESQKSSDPHKELRQKYPFGSFGINFGVKINL